VDSRVDMLDRFGAMAMELAVGVLHMFTCVPQLLDRIVHARVRWHWGRSAAAGLAGATADRQLVPLDQPPLPTRPGSTGALL
jgi:hypothetical protein